MKKINIAELLKDCPKGMELDCTIWDSDVKVFFKEVLNDNFTYPVVVTMKYNNIEYTKSFTKYGSFNDRPYCKCVIFPKGKTTWEGFVPHKFKDGDILSYQYKGFKNRTIFIYMYHSRMNTTYYAALSGATDSEFMINDKKGYALNSYDDTVRLATEKEKAKLFQAIKDNGYRWNVETKTLEKLIEPKFKVGDRIKHIVGREEIATVVGIEKLHYNLDSKVGTSSFSISLQHEWELVPNKFDINTLVPFVSKVLVRNDESQRWLPAFWGYKVVDGFITTFGWCKYCIPYKDNEHLLGTTDDCDKFFKLGEK